MEPSFLNDPLNHAASTHLCAACGAPDLPGVSCFCVDPVEPEESCSTCGSVAPDYEASCPECRVVGRVEKSLARFFGRSLPTGPIPSLELLPEEPLPTERPRSWWPSAAE